MPKKYNKIKDLNELSIFEKNLNFYEFLINNSYSSLLASVKLIGQTI